MEIGLNEVMVPKDLEYLKKILPELEELKAKQTRIIDKYLRGVFSPKLRRELYGNAWDMLMWEPNPKLKKETKDDEKTVRD
jgi:hypothetical protein